MSACAYIYHFDFTLDPKSYSTAQVSVCEVKQYIEVKIRVDAKSETAITEQLMTIRRMLSVFNSPIENVTWEHHRLDELEEFLREEVARFSRDVSGKCVTTVAELEHSLQPTHHPLAHTLSSSSFNPREKNTTPPGKLAKLNAESEVYIPPMNRIGRMHPPIERTIQRSPSMRIDPMILKNVVNTIASSNNCPAIDMSNHTSAKKLRNYINNITNASLQPGQIDAICDWLVSNYSHQPTGGKKYFDTFTNNIPRGRDF